MPLSAPVARKIRHDRDLRMIGYEREDGLWDIEAHLCDLRGYDIDNAWRGRIEAGTPYHDMWIRLTVDETLTIQAVEALIDAGPYQACPDISAGFAVLKGKRIAPGWNQRVRTLLGGAKGCVHMVQMLGPMGTVAFQTLGGKRVLDAQDAADKRVRTRPPRLNSCHVLADDGEEVKKRWPEFYTGPKD
jgi:hypothetical protein